MRIEFLRPTAEARERLERIDQFHGKVDDLVVPSS